jgi:hypothetical protein
MPVAVLGRQRRLPPGSRRDRLGIVDPRIELSRSEAAEDDRVDRTNACASEHRHDGLGNHRHVHDDAIPGSDAEAAKDSGEELHLGKQFGVG